MDQDRLERLVRLAQEDIAQKDLRRAKARLKSVLQLSPNHQPAQELLGHIYYQYGDYRNAIMHWSRANYWRDPATEACRRVFRFTGRALVRENPRAARYHLYAFAGGTLPDDLRDTLTTLQEAYYRYNNKKSKLSGLACAPLCGACMIAVIGLTTVLLGAGWSWFLWMGALALVATGGVVAVSTWSYLNAARLFRETIDPFRILSRQ
jgi:tetratricopeptide (TPR) repeat protein